jgi:hypothetical protein
MKETSHKNRLKVAGQWAPQFQISVGYSREKFLQSKPLQFLKGKLFLIYLDAIELFYSIYR